MATAKPVAVGVFRDVHGLRAYVKARGQLYSKRFPPDALGAAKRWREEARARHILKLPDTPRRAGSTLADDAVAYLKAVRGMPSYADRQRDIDAWVAAFGARARASLASVEIRQQLETWKVERKYAASTLNHRRTALAHLFRVLDGKAASNPVADVPKYQEREHAALIFTPADIRRTLGQIQDSKAKRVLTAAAWTGWPYKQISQLTPADLSKLDQGVARVTPRRKGAGSAGRWLPLLPEAIAALKALRLPEDVSSIHRKNLHRAWRNACVKADLTPCRPYDLRHAFGTLIARKTKDARAVYELMLHSSPTQSLRYTKAAGIDRATAAIRLVTASNRKGAKAGVNPPQSSRRKAARNPKKPRK